MLLLFRMGDFYELFDDDAEVVSRVLGLTLTSRDNDDSDGGLPAPQPSTPICASCSRPAIASPSATRSRTRPQAKGLVRREVTRVVTPGTFTEDDLLDPRQANHLVALTAAGAARRDRPGLGRSVHRAVPRRRRARASAWSMSWPGSPPRSAWFAEKRADAEATGAARRPAASLLSGADRHGAARLDLRSPTRPGRPCSIISASRTMAGFGFDDQQPVPDRRRRAAAVPAGDAQGRAWPTSAGCGRIAENRFLLLDEVTRRSLELTRTLRDGDRHGSLLARHGPHRHADGRPPAGTNGCSRRWPSAPAIERRLDAVGELLDEHGLRQELRASLAEASDLQRLTARVSTGRASPRDLARRRPDAAPAAAHQGQGDRPHVGAAARPGSAARAVPRPARAAGGGPRRRPAARPPAKAASSAAATTPNSTNCTRSPAAARNGSPASRPTRSPAPASPASRSASTRSSATTSRSPTPTPAKIPPDYQRKQTLKNAERYITPELKEYEEKVLTAEEKIQPARIRAVPRPARPGRRPDGAGCCRRPRCWPGSTCWRRLAELAVRAQLLPADASSTSRSCDIVDGRHPVLDQTLPPGTFVPNDVGSGPGATAMFLLITGPNMGGKSIFIRQVALLDADGPDGQLRAGRRGHGSAWSTASSRASAPATS